MWLRASDRLSLPTAKSTEGKPQEWAAGRDAVRTAETRESDCNERNSCHPLFELLPDLFLAVSVPNANAQSHENAEPTGTISGTVLSQGDNRTLSQVGVRLKSHAAAYFIAF